MHFDKTDILFKMGSFLGYPTFKVVEKEIYKLIDK